MSNPVDAGGVVGGKPYDSKHAPKHGRVDTILGSSPAARVYLCNVQFLGCFICLAATPGCHCWQPFRSKLLPAGNSFNGPLCKATDFQTVPYTEPHSYTYGNCITKEILLQYLCQSDRDETGTRFQEVYLYEAL
jgi:hypothetical protein